MDHLPKVALVIGIAEYASCKLKTSIDDARGIAAALEKAGSFTVTLCLDPDLPALVTCISNFTASLPSACLALVYFAGHSMLWHKTNQPYIMCRTYDSCSSTDLAFRTAAYSLQDLLQDIASAVQEGAVIALLDTCTPAASKAASMPGASPIGPTDAARILVNMSHNTELLTCHACSQPGSIGEGLYSKHLMQTAFDPKQPSGFSKAIGAANRAVHAESGFTLKPQMTTTDPSFFDFQLMAAPMHQLMPQATVAAAPDSPVTSETSQQQHSPCNGNHAASMACLQPDKVEQHSQPTALLPAGKQDTNRATLTVNGQMQNTATDSSCSSSNMLLTVRDVQHLDELFQQRDTSTLAEAAQALCESCTSLYNQCKLGAQDSIISGLVSLLQQQPCTAACIAAAEALSAMCRGCRVNCSKLGGLPVLIDSLASMLRSSDVAPECCIAAACAVASLVNCPSGALAVLGGCHVGYHAANCARLEEAGIVGILGSLLKDSDCRVRKAAVQAVQAVADHPPADTTEDSVASCELHQDGTLGALVALLHDADQGTQGAACAALTALGRRGLQDSIISQPGLVSRLIELLSSSKLSNSKEASENAVQVQLQAAMCLKALAAGNKAHTDSIIAAAGGTTKLLGQLSIVFTEGDQRQACCAALLLSLLEELELISAIGGGGGCWSPAQLLQGLLAEFKYGPSISSANSFVAFAASSYPLLNSIVASMDEQEIYLCGRHFQHGTKYGIAAAPAVQLALARSMRLEHLLTFLKAASRNNAVNAIHGCLSTVEEAYSSCSDFDRQAAVCSLYELLKLEWCCMRSGSLSSAAAAIHSSMEAGVVDRLVELLHHSNGHLRNVAVTVLYMLADKSVSLWGNSKDASCSLDAAQHEAAGCKRHCEAVHAQLLRQPGLHCRLVQLLLSDTDSKVQSCAAEALLLLCGRWRELNTAEDEEGEDSFENSYRVYSELYDAGLCSSSLCSESLYEQGCHAAANTAIVASTIQEAGAKAAIQLFLAVGSNIGGASELYQLLERSAAWPGGLEALFSSVVFEQLPQLLTSASPRTRVQAFAAVRRYASFSNKHYNAILSQPGVKDCLLQILDDQDSLVRLEAVTHIKFLMGYPVGLDAVGARRGRSRSAAQYAAPYADAAAAQRAVCDGPMALAKLGALLKDSSPAVRRTCLKRLVSIWGNVYRARAAGGAISSSTLFDMVYNTSEADSTRQLAMSFLWEPESDRGLSKNSSSAGDNNADDDHAEGTKAAAASDVDSQSLCNHKAHNPHEEWLDLMQQESNFSKLTELLAEPGGGVGPSGLTKRTAYDWLESLLQERPLLQDTFLSSSNALKVLAIDPWLVDRCSSAPQAVAALLKAADGRIKLAALRSMLSIHKEDAHQQQAIVETLASLLQSDSRDERETAASHISDILASAADDEHRSLVINAVAAYPEVIRGVVQAATKGGVHARRTLISIASAGREQQELINQAAAETGKVGCVQAAVDLLIVKLDDIICWHAIERSDNIKAAMFLMDLVDGCPEHQVAKLKAEMVQAGVLPKLANLLPRIGYTAAECLAVICSGNEAYLDMLLAAVPATGWLLQQLCAYIACGRLASGLSGQKSSLKSSLRRRLAVAALLTNILNKPPSQRLAGGPIRYTHAGSVYSAALCDKLIDVGQMIGGKTATKKKYCRYTYYKKQVYNIQPKLLLSVVASLPCKEGASTSGNAAAAQQQAAAEIAALLSKVLTQ